MKLVRPLLFMRWTALQNQTQALRIPFIVGGTALSALLIVFGFMAAPSLLIPPSEVATPRGFVGDTFPAGTTALEAAFWVSAVLLAVLSFRVMELLFRRNDIRSVDIYPIDLPSLFVDRFVAIIADTMLAVIAAAIFFAPLIWYNALDIWLLCCALVVVALIVGQCLSLATYLFVGHSQLRPISQSTISSSNSTQKSSTRGDVYGGSGQAFIYAPGLALAIGVVHALFAKLVLGEYLRVAGISNAMMYGLMIIAIVAAISIALAGRYFIRDFPRIAARFREADFVGFETYGNYQQSAFTKPSRLGAIFRDPTTYAFFRMLLLQYSRRYMLSRYGFGLIFFAAFIAGWQLSPQAFPAWAMAAIPTLLLTVFTNPWHRLNNAMFNPQQSIAMPFSSRHEANARAIFIGRELTLITVPLIVIIIVTRGIIHTDIYEALLIALTAILIPVAVYSVMAIAQAFHRRVTGVAQSLPLWPIAPIMGMILLAIAIASMLISMIISLSLILCFPLSRTNKPHQQSGISSQV